MSRKRRIVVVIGKITKGGKLPGRMGKAMKGSLKMAENTGLECLNGLMRGNMWEKIKWKRIVY